MPKVLELRGLLRFIAILFTGSTLPMSVLANLECWLPFKVLTAICANNMVLICCKLRGYNYSVTMDSRNQHEVKISIYGQK